MPSAPSTTAKVSSNPYLRGNFAPVQSENSISELPVKGKIPEELEGRFLRIGPNPVSQPNAKFYHWFMGTGMVHGVRLKGGKALSYTNNFVVSDDVTSTLNKKRLPTPRKTRGSSVNTNILCIAGELFAVVEAGELPIKLNPNLESIEHSDFSGTLQNGFTAHPRKDPETGELHAITYEPGRSTVDYVVIDTAGRAKTVTQIHAPHGPMIHDTAITPSFVVVLDLPVNFNMLKVITGTFPYSWNMKRQSRIGLLPRTGDQTQMLWFDAPAYSVYHIMNAFEIEDKVVVDVVKNSINFDADMLKRENSSPQLVRWTLNRTTGKLAEQLLSEHAVEFPRLNDNYTGKDYRYGYTATFTADLQLGAAYKHDLLKGNTLVHDFGPGRATMEPVFVPKPGATAEDEGWLLSYVFDENTNKSDVVILDAQDFEGAPLATIHLPVRVPFGFHGNWIADSELKG